MATHYYRPSGRFSPSIVPRLVVISLVTIMFAWLYAYSSLHFQAIIRFFAPLIFTVIMIGVGGFLSKQAEVRNPSLMFGIA